ncbi:hypothetical protein [Pseudanabaena sp. UWO310]|uniref:hypothetical protein n=1 Tax=Pseudanabaena sp. UWO310 TaxID=2480795 RepID=UPI0011611ED2|nr:hypothetical protein [Pseudanabaena sp. UWO310]TYQ23682.1 hypothetical protein PseudUWO310_21990 [Pseudanabaena sp. UWO310]
MATVQFKTEISAELELLQQINRALPAELQQQYNDLSAKMRSQTITPEEHQDLLQLIDIVEQADGDRLKHLIQLSQLRNISLTELMEQLQIYPQLVHS